MSGIVEFIKARIDEDERAALEWPERRRRWVDDGATIYSGHATDLIVDWVHEDRGSEHIARHDPARVLAEVAARRQRLGQLEYMAQWHDGDMPDVTDHEIRMMRTAAKLLLQLEAHPWSAHPDFDLSWRSIYVDEPAGLYETVGEP